jgi:serine/threonine protein kinase
MESFVGQTLGAYRILERVGRGGMATVYKAYQPSLDRYVALKVLPAHLTDEAGFAERFRREARAVAKLEHPHILPVHDYGQEGDLTYIAMRYVEGGTLKDLCGKPLELRLIVDLIGQIGGALDHAHERGIVHRDVKPSNVLLDRGNWALLTDFGVARMVEGTQDLTGTGVGVGTPAYMSPEQGQGKKVDRRSDVYSLGVVLYEMLTGRVPYEADTPIAVVMKHINDPLPLPRKVNPRVPEVVERVVLKALAKSPEDRYQTAGEMARALRAEIEETAVIRVRPSEAGDVQTEDFLTPAASADTPRGSSLHRLKRLWPAPLALGVLVLLVIVLRPPPAGPEAAPTRTSQARPTAARVAGTASALSPTPSATLVERAKTASPTPAPLPESSNDNFADAIVMEELPFSISLNTSAAAREDEEPQECPGYPGAAAFMQKTVWYRFTPETTMGLDLEGNTDLEIGVVVYTGSSLDSLTEVGCFVAGGQWQGTIPTIFFGGTTYYLQVGAPLGANISLMFRPHQ